MRRERAHPGAQLSLFDDIEGRRHTAFITNQDGDAPVLGVSPRQRGRSRRRHPRPQSLRLRKLAQPRHRQQPSLGPLLSDGVQPAVQGHGSPSPAATGPPHPRPSATGSSTSPDASPLRVTDSTSTATGPGPRTPRRDPPHPNPHQSPRSVTAAVPGPSPGRKIVAKSIELPAELGQFVRRYVEEFEIARRMWVRRMVELDDDVVERQLASAGTLSSRHRRQLEARRARFGRFD